MSTSLPDNDFAWKLFAAFVVLLLLLFTEVDASEESGDHPLLLGLDSCELGDDLIHLLLLLLLLLLLFEAGVRARFGTPKMNQNQITNH